MKILIYLIICIALLLNVSAGTLQGTVHRKVTLKQQLPPDRYLARQISEPVSDTTGENNNPNLAVIYLTGSQPVTSEPTDLQYEIKQQGIKFDPWLLPVQVGSTVNFPNMDLVFHNVFSYSRTKKFDLGRYSSGESKSVTFDKPGLVKIYCEIHKNMRIKLNSQFTRSPDGTVYSDDIYAIQLSLNI